MSKETADSTNHLKINETEIRTSPLLLYGTLPKEYREYLETNSNLIVELTTGCHGHCNFCDNPRQGDIGKSMDWQTITKIIDLWDGNKKTILFHHWNDEFDWKDPFSHTFEDVAKYAINKNHPVFTSTTIPKDSIEAIINLEKFIVQEKKYSYHTLRISHTPENTTEMLVMIERLKTSLQPYGEVNIFDKGILFSPVTKEPFQILGHIDQRFIFGNVALTPNTKTDYSHINIMDFLGRGTNDAVIFTPQGLDIAITMPHCNVAPNGYLRFSYSPDKPIWIIPKNIGDKYSEFLTEARQLEVYPGSQLPENMPFIKAARKLYALFIKLYERGAIGLKNSDPLLSPSCNEHFWITTKTPGCKKPIFPKEARLLRHTIEENYSFFKGDEFAEKHLSRVIEEMGLIEKKEY